MVLSRDVVGLLQLRSRGIQGAKTGFQRLLVEPVIARLALLALDQNAGFLQGAGVVAEQRQRNIDGVGDVFTGAFLAVYQEFHDLESGRVTQSLEDFGSLG